MPDYTTQATMTPGVRLTKAMRHVIGLMGGNHEVEDQGSLLEDVAAGEENANTVYYVFWEDGFSDIEDYEIEERIEAGDFVRGTPECAEFERLAKMVVGGAFEEFLREILFHNPEVKHVEVHKSYTCSRMRDDGFGGEGVFVTRTHFGIVCDKSLMVDEKTGEIAVVGDLIHKFAGNDPRLGPVNKNTKKTKKQEPKEPRALTQRERDLIVAALNRFEIERSEDNLNADDEETATASDKWPQPNSKFIAGLVKALRSGEVEIEADNLLEKMAQAAAKKEKKS